MNCREEGRMFHCPSINPCTDKIGWLGYHPFHFTSQIIQNRGCVPFQFHLRKLFHNFSMQASMIRKTQQKVADS